MKKIAHLALDEKFVDSALRDFNRIDGIQNDLFIFSRKKISLIKSDIFYKASIIDLILKRKILSRLGQYDIIILHSLSPFWCEFVLKLPPVIKIHWIGWGFDYYDLIEDKKIVISDNQSQGLLRKFFFKNKIKKLLFNSSKDQIIECVNYFSPVLKSEFEMLKKIKSWRKFPSYLEWNYGNLEEDLLKKLMEQNVDGNNVLVGNSATKTNNHIDAFELLVDKLNDNQKVIVPLSYGVKSYGDYIEKKGYEVLGGYFYPLREFMPIEEYLKLLLSCGLVIMNHVRQQAYGNIIIMLFLGAKVFLRKENPIYSHLKSLGLEVYCIDDFNTEKTVLFLEENRMKNREILFSLWSKQASLKRTRNVIKVLVEG